MYFSHILTKKKIFFKETLEFVLFPELEHFPEYFELSDAGGDAAERVEQRNDLVPGQMRQSG